MTDRLTLADVVGVLDGLYDPRWAEDWDAVGLVAGDPQQPVRRVLLAVDPAQAVIDEAVAWGADLLVTHHPLLLRGVHSVAGTPWTGVSSSGWWVTSRSAPVAITSSTTAVVGSTANSTRPTGSSGSPQTRPTASQLSASAGS